jgi:hypothetical protein
MRIGTWNLENLFKPGADAGPTSPQAYQAKPDGLAATITALDPDLPAVQEVGDPDALTDLAKKLAGRGYDHLETADSDRRGIRVGFLSRLPLLDVHQVAVFPAPLRPIQVDDTATAEDVVAGLPSPSGSPLRRGRGSSWSPVT